MIRKLISVAAIVMLCAGMAAAQEKMEQKESGLASWLKSMQKKLDIVNPRKTMPMTTGVAGVRGAKEDNGKGKLYWKGKKGDEQVTEAELKEFREGLAFAEAGDTASAVHEFEEFMSLYPDSPLIPDVKKTLDMVKAAPNAGARVEPKEETRAEAKTEAGPKPEPKAEPKAETK